MLIRRKSRSGAAGFAYKAIFFSSVCILSTKNTFNFPLDRTKTLIFTLKSPSKSGCFKSP